MRKWLDKRIYGYRVGDLITHELMLAASLYNGHIPFMYRFCVVFTVHEICSKIL